MKKSKRNSIIFVMLALSYVLLLGTNSWAGSYQCQILKIIHSPDGVMVHVNPGVTETGFTGESKVFIKNDAQSKGMIDMLLSAASGNMEIIINTVGEISWAPQTVNSMAIVVSDVDSPEQRAPWYGPVFLESYAVDHTGSYYFVSDPKKLPENAIAVRVPPHQPAIASLMTSAFMNGKSVSVIVSHRWWLGSGKLA